MNLFAKKNVLTHIRNKLMVTKGEGGDKLKSLGLQITLFKTDKQGPTI